MGQPLARLTDEHLEHLCPLCDATVPHVGGPVCTGAQIVLAGGLPVARAGDQAVCLGPSDTIVQGSSTVFIQGVPAARSGDRTLHGGMLVAGQANVLVGGGTFDVRALWYDADEAGYGTSIIVRRNPEHDSSFVSRTVAALLRLDGTPTARAILDSLESAGRKVAIESYDGGYNATYSDGVIAWSPDVRTDSSPSSDAILGRMLGHAASPSADGAATERAIRDDYATRGIRT
jgi:uncharacterized Zn-binding protein involved in type VI secretion